MAFKLILTIYHTYFPTHEILPNGLYTVWTDYIYILIPDRLWGTEIKTMHLTRTKSTTIVPHGETNTYWNVFNCTASSKWKDAEQNSCQMLLNAPPQPMNSMQWKANNGSIYTANMLRQMKATTTVHDTRERARKFLCPAAGNGEWGKNSRRRP